MSSLTAKRVVVPVIEGQMSFVLMTNSFPAGTYRLLFGLSIAGATRYADTLEHPGFESLDRTNNRLD